MECPNCGKPMRYDHYTGCWECADCEETDCGDQEQKDDDYSDELEKESERQQWTLN